MRTFASGKSFETVSLALTISIQLLTCSVGGVGAAEVKYPVAEKGDVVDSYSGIKVADPYRWLEDANSDKTAAWVKSENEVTAAFLSKIVARPLIKARLNELWNYERCGVPNKKDARLFYSKNDGLQNQNVLYVQDAADKNAKGKVLLDPNKLSKDGTVDLANYEITDDSRLMAYGLSSAGSDWQVWHVKDVVKNEDLSDEIKFVKNGSVAFLKDGSGFYYSRYDEPAAGQELQAANYFQKLFFHRIGEAQAKDRLIYERKDQKEWEFSPTITDDGRYLIVQIFHGTSPKNGVLIQDLQDRKSSLNEVVPVGRAMFNFVGQKNEQFWFLTDEDAPRGRIVEARWSTVAACANGSIAKDKLKEIVKESTDTLESVSTVNNSFVCSYMQDAHSSVKIHGLDGQLLTNLALPGFGTVSGFGGKIDDRETYYSYTSFNTPAKVYHLDLKALLEKKGAQSQEVFFAPRTHFNADDFTTEQIFFESKDGTKLPMFVSYKKGLKLDGKNPTYLYGYGGFKIPLLPTFSPANLFWMESGGIYAMPALRGGGEYGEAWHEAGMKAKKQNVFDDFIAAAQTLVARKYTSKEKLAIGGGSNGGLLVGACLTQCPELYQAAIPAVGVMDMLRFNKFTVGWGWTQEYGSPEDAEEFKSLIKYSPLHNIKKGVCYPATMVTTADHDDRVVPGHSFKFAAALQAAQSTEHCDNPVLIRIDTKAGHGHGKSTEKIIDEAADKWAFLFQELGVEASTALRK
jgi:prolyl oligopeptidase